MAAGVHVSLGSADTLVRRGGITNHHSIAYSLSNISDKNYQNQLMSVEFIVCNVSVVFLKQCIITFNFQYDSNVLTLIINKSMI